MMNKKANGEGRNKMKSKFLVSALLIFALCISACGSGGGSGSLNTSTDQTNSSAAEMGTEGSSDAPPTIITALINIGNTITVDPDEMPSFQQFEKDMNVKIEWQVVRSGWDEQKAILLSSGDLPDTFWGNRTLNISDVQTNLGLFAKLNDYIDTSTNIDAMFAEEPGMKELVTFPDGSIYTLPQRMPLRPDTYDAIYINQTWLDNLGLPMPDTLDSFYNTLVAFRDDDPTGKGTEVIPYSTQGTGSAFGPWWIFNSFGLQCNMVDDMRLMIAENGDILYTPTMEGFREGIRYLNKLYTEGLYDAEAFTQDWGMWAAKCEAEEIIVGVAGMWTINTLFGNANAPNYSTMPPLKDSNGVQRWRSNPVWLRSSPMTWAMSESSPNKDLAFALIDHIYLPENSVQLYFGSYGVGLDNTDPDQIRIIESPDPDQSYDNWLWTNSFGDMGPFYVSHNFEQKIDPNPWVLEKAKIDDIYQPFIPPADRVFPRYIYTTEENNEMSIIKTDVDRIVNTSFAAWVTGESDVDADWDSYLASLESAGLPRLMEIYINRYEQAQNN